MYPFGGRCYRIALIGHGFASFTSLFSANGAAIPWTKEPATLYEGCGLSCIRLSVAGGYGFMPSLFAARAAASPEYVGAAAPISSVTE